MTLSNDVVKNKIEELIADGVIQVEEVVRGIPVIPSASAIMYRYSNDPTVIYLKPGLGNIQAEEGVRRLMTPAWYLDISSVRDLTESIES
jgi:hypothetical protein